MAHDSQGILSMLMMQRIISLLQGNGVSAEQIFTGQIVCDGFLIEIIVDWQLKRESHVVQVAGLDEETKQEMHFGKNKEQFEQHRAEVLREIDDEEREKHQLFIQEMVSKDVSALAESTHAYHYTNLPSFSRHDSCPVCNSYLVVKCKGCGGTGFKECHFCDGRGLVGRYTDDGHLVEDKCPECDYGKNQCYDCKGKGTFDCTSCEGKGVFTYICHVETVAQPNVSIRVQSPTREQTLREYFQQQGIKQCLKWFDFHLWHQRKGRFHYRADSVVLEQHFHIFLKNYKVLAFNDELLYIQRPKVFDDLLAGEIAYLKDSRHPKGIRHYDQAMTIFKRSQDYAILKLAMQNLAEQKLQHPQQCIEDTCQSFISTENAQLIGNEFQRALKRLSPPFAQSIWVFQAIKTLFLTLLVISYQCYLILFHEDKTFWGLVIAFLIGLYAFALYDCMKKNKQKINQLLTDIPKEYRQPIRCKKANLWYLIAHGVFIILLLFIAFIAWAVDLEYLYDNSWHRMIFQYGFDHEHLSNGLSRVWQWLFGKNNTQHQP